MWSLVVACSNTRVRLIDAFCQVCIGREYLERAGRESWPEDELDGTAMLLVAWAGSIQAPFVDEPSEPTSFTQEGQATARAVPRLVLRRNGPRLATNAAAVWQQLEMGVNGGVRQSSSRRCALTTEVHPHEAPRASSVA